jgi:uncharacterized protein (TIGR01319 family)
MRQIKGMLEDKHMILLTDFGSTYTKLTAVDIEKLEVKAAARAVTTVDTDVMIGLRNALDILKGQLGKNIRFREKLAASSAAGGLRMVAVGLVPELTARAAELAALKAGAKVVGVYSYKLTEDCEVFRRKARSQINLNEYTRC